VAALERLDFDPAELERIDRYAVEGQINIWASSSEG
jgi:L-glyceraldehyde 3-phosphate reductase